MKTFRTRLILWNVILLTIGLLGFGLLLVTSSERQVMSAIDREIVDRASRAGPPRGGQGGQGGPGGGPQGQGLNGLGGQPGFQDGDGGDGGPGGSGGRGGPGAGGAPPNPNDVRLPRWQDRDGNVGSPAGPVQFFTNAGVDRAWAGQVDIRSIDWNGRRIRIATAPMGRERPPFRIGQAATEMDEVEAVFQRQRSTLLLLIPVAMIVAALGGLFMANRALRPVEAMASAAEKIGAEDLGKRLPAEGDDEMGQLARTFNGLIARLQESFGQQKSAYQKLETAFEAQRQFTADASHELRTPLSRMKLVSSAALSQNASADEKKEALQIVDRTADEMSRLVQDLLDLARADAAALNFHLEKTDLHLAAEAAAEEFRLTGAARIVVEGDGQAMADGRALHRILRNLLANAVRHTPEFGLITIRAEGSNLTVTDTGEGISPEHLPHLAKRFYRGDADRSRASGGTGLGLAITKTLAEAMGGTLAIESSLGQGTRVTLRLAA